MRVKSNPFKGQEKNHDKIIASSETTLFCFSPQKTASTQQGTWSFMGLKSDGRVPLIHTEKILDVKLSGEDHGRSR